jgi:hypothetical protein
MDFCGCQGTPRYIQLLRGRLFPASWKFPATAFTLACLNDFRNLSQGTKLSAHHFYKFLCRKTDSTGIKIINVCHSNLSDHRYHCPNLFCIRIGEMNYESPFDNCGI